MEKNPKIIPEKINLFHLNVVESHINAVQYEKKPKYSVKVGHSLMHNIELKRLKINMIIELDALAEEQEKPNSNARFVIEFHFQIENIDDFMMLKSENDPVFHSLLIATLLGICYSTARGVVYQSISKTAMAGVILPVVSPQKMMRPNSDVKDK